MWSSMTPLEYGGTIAQVESANTCALNGDPAVSFNSGKFCIMASVKQLPPLAESHTVQKIVDMKNTGLTYAGFEPDFRILSKHVFKNSLSDRLTDISSAGKRVGQVLQEMTHVCAVRPYGLALIMTGFDLLKNMNILKFDAYGQSSACHVAAVGIGAEDREQYLVDQFEYNMSLRSGLLIAIESLTLDECEKFLKPRNFEIAVLDEDNGFRPLCKRGVKYVVEQIQCW